MLSPIAILTSAVVAIIVLVLMIRMRLQSSAWKTEIKQAIERSGYFERFNEIDIAARGCPTAIACKSGYLDSIRLPNEQEAMRLNLAIQVVGAATQKHPKLHAVPWRIVVFGPAYEAGFPHTHGQTIFMPSDYILSAPLDKFANTMLHEKIHVFQRMYPFETLELLKRLGYEPHSMRSPDSKYRSNPDINGIMFSDADGNLVTSEYAPGAKTLAHLKDNRDHPYEVMAYMLPPILLGAPGKSSGIIMSWANEYLT